VLSLTSFSLAQTTSAQKIEEAYGKSFLEDKPELTAQLYRLLDSRVHVAVQKAEEGEKYARLSAIALHDKLNPGLVRDTVFDPLAFNPLKYELDFFAQTIQVYRIDNSDYLLIIDPQ